MGVNRINGADDNGHDQDDNNSAAVIRLELNPDEARILLNACRRYRSTIPSYLQAKQMEVNVIDSIIKTLAD